MPKKLPPLRIVPVQHVVGIPITDPAELAAMDRMRQRLKGKRARKRALPPLRIVPVQHVVGIPITDPAEQAAIDRMRRRMKRKRAGRRKTNGK
jgi:hypothetical protein